MSKNSLCAGLVCLLAIPVLTSLAHAQLNDVEWSESCSAVTNLGSDSNTGSDPNMPEPQTASLSGGSYSISGSVSFAGGPPNVTSHLEGSYTSGLTYMGGTAYCRIDYSFVVRELASPPVISVGPVPVNVTVQGTVGVTGDAALFANAYAAATLSTTLGPLRDWTITVSNDQGQASDSFNETARIDLDPDQVVMGDLTASANIAGEVLQSGTSSSGTAWIDPVIEIADELIPGSSFNFRDYYEIEVAPGYWALGTAPVASTTWGRLKNLYRN